MAEAAGAADAGLPPVLVAAFERALWEGDPGSEAALGAFGPEAAPVLVRRLGRGDPRASHLARSLLVAVGGAAAPALNAGLADPRAEAREGCLRVAADLSLSSFAPAARRLLRDPDPRVVLAAARVLAATRDAGAAPDVAELLTAEDPRLRAAAARTLKRLGDRGTAARLVPRLRDPDPAVRDAAAAALASLGQPGSARRWPPAPGPAPTGRAGPPAAAAPPPFALDETDRRLLRAALQAGGAELGDLANPRGLVPAPGGVPVAARALDDPLALPGLADRLLALAALLPGDALVAAVDLAWDRPADRDEVAEPDPADLPLAEALSAVVAAFDTLHDVSQAVFAGLSPAAVARAVHALGSGPLDPEDQDTLHAALYGSPAALSALDAPRRAADFAWADAVFPPLAAIDPRPAVAATRGFITACDRLARAVSAADPGALRALAAAPPPSSRTGRSVQVGGPGPDAWDGEADLVIDLGGDDRYGGRAGGARHGERAAAAVVDLGGGRDRYESDVPASLGGALFAVAVLYEDGGDDRYDGAIVSTGAALGGIGVVVDRAGHDRYRAPAFAQGAGAFGIGVLLDGAGDDESRIGSLGQGFGWVAGLGLLLDGGGDDLRIAGGGKGPSFAQGAGLGERPLAGGGIGVLVDVGGDDRDLAGALAQGSGYFSALGVLVDGGGDDDRVAGDHSQGAGAAQGVGALLDRGGDDRLVGATRCQGSGSDLAVGLLLDAQGDDLYAARDLAQGAASGNSFALALDRGGDDAWLLAGDVGQGAAGDETLDRGWGDRAVWLDEQGRDRAAGTAGDGGMAYRGRWGVHLDAAVPGPTSKD